MRAVDSKPIGRAVKHRLDHRVGVIISTPAGQPAPETTGVYHVQWSDGSAEAVPARLLASVLGFADEPVSGLHRAEA
jgi:hypothetical protein